MNKKVIVAKDVMEDSFIELDGMATVTQALESMQSKNADVVIVKKRDDNDAYGIVLLSDVAKKVLAKNHSPDRINLYEVMAKPVISVEPDLDVRYCARLFDRFGLSIAPVKDNDQIIGVVSYRELVFKGLLEELKG